MKIVYTKELLDKILNDNKSTLIGEYETINSLTIINFICSCGTSDSKVFRYIVSNSGTYCKKCTIEKSKQKRVETNRKLFGTDYPLQSTDKMESLKKTNRDKYGYDFGLSSNDVIKKRKNTILNKSAIEIEKTKNKMKEIFQNKSEYERKSILEKRKQTNLKKYGVTTTLLNPETKEKIINTIRNRYDVETNISQSNLIQNKIKENCLEKYGVKNHQSREDVKEKTKNTNLERYGVIAPTCLDDIQNKVKETNIKRYGVEYPLQNSEIHEKSSKISKRYKNYTFPSGQTKRVQGYEPFALDELLKEFCETEIIIGRTEIPTIRYTINSKNHTYFPDIFIPKINKIIEVKSTWTYSCKKDNVLAKAKECLLQGYSYEIWIYDRNRIKTVINKFL